MSGDPAQEYFADGITETLITDLSKLRGLKVIARNSVFAYKGKSVDVRQVGRELGVRHVLEGSLQRAGDRIRINAQLVAAATGDHLWADRYDRPMQDLFTLQDEITRRIVTELDVKLSEGEQTRVWRRGTQSIEAYDYFLKARQAAATMNRQNAALARELAGKALALDPNFAMAHFVQGWMYYFEASSGWTPDNGLTFEQARTSSRRAIELDDSIGAAYAILAAISMSFDLDHDRALEFGRKSVALSPSGAFEHAALSLWQTYSGYPDEGLEAARKAFQLSPIPDSWYYHPLGAAKLFAGHYEEAIQDYTRCLAKIPDFIWCNANMTVALMLAGREAEARAQAKHVLRINPKFVVDSAPLVLRIKSPEWRDRFADALKRAGLP
jgi:adenylate cyclase